MVSIAVAAAAMAAAAAATAAASTPSLSTYRIGVFCRCGCHWLMSIRLAFVVATGSCFGL